MEIAAFVISIFALIIALLGLGLAMRSLYLIGVNSGLDKQFRQQFRSVIPTLRRIGYQTDISYTGFRSFDRPSAGGMILHSGG